MSKPKVELQVVNISGSQVQAGAYAMLLAEKDGDRQLPIIIGASEAQAIIMELRGITPPRPLTHELFASVIQVLGAKILRVLIYRAENGIFYSYIFLSAGEKLIRVDSRTSDAIALALHTQAPILIYEDILEAEKLNLKPEKPVDETNQKQKLKNDPVNQMQSIEIIKSALDKAIANEDYEQAAVLRDMIKNFKHLNPTD